ncbi:MAG: hypothetical protein ACYDAG_04785 [Chloroflexota bacterium]
MNAVLTRNLHERVADELRRWQAHCGDLVPEAVRDHLDDIARDVALGFGLGFIDAVAIGAISEERPEGGRQLLAVSRLRLAEPPYPAVQPARADNVAPGDDDIGGMGIWLRPTARGRAADVSRFFTMLRREWNKQDVTRRVLTTRPLQAVELTALTDELSLIREGYGDVRFAF